MAKNFFTDYPERVDLLNKYSRLRQLAMPLEQAFGEEGTYPYACAYHPGMVGVIVVGDGGHRALAARVTADGYAALSSTVVAGRPVLRLCTINPRTTVEDLAGTVAAVRRLAV